MKTCKNCGGKIEFDADFPNEPFCKKECAEEYEEEIEKREEKV